MPKTTIDPLALALGELEIAATHADHVLGREEAVEQRLRDAEAALVAAQARDAREVLAKIERAWEALHEDRDGYGSLIGRLEAVQRAVAAPGADLGAVAASLRVLARQLKQEGARDFHCALLRSAASDAAALARAT